MLRINLLPSYVQQRRLTKRLILPFLLLFIICVAAPLAAYFVLHGKLVSLTQEASDAVDGKGKTDALKAEATTTIAQVAPIQQKLQFVTDVDAYARKWVAKYAQLAQTTPRSSFIYSGAEITGPTMAIKAYSPSVESVGQYLQVMYHEPDFSTVAVDHIPAYPDNIRHLYYLDGVLVFADGASGGSGNSGGGGGFRGGGFPGGSGGRFPGAGGFGGGGYPGAGGGGGQAAAAAPANFTADALGPNGATNIPPDVGPPPAEIAVGGTGGTTPGRPATGGYPGGGQAGGGQTGSYSAAFLRVAGRGISPFASPQIREQIYQKKLRQVVVKTVPKGFDINVTATLKEPLTAPVPPGSAPAAGASPGGYPGGPPGGFPGGPGGSYPGGPGGPPGAPPPPPGRSA